LKFVALVGRNWKQLVRELKTWDDFARSLKTASVEVVV